MVCLRLTNGIIPKARIDLYRQNPASIRIRIVDPRFPGMSRADRNAYVWKYFDQLTDEVAERHQHARPTDSSGG